VQTKNRTVSKYANENTSICAILNVAAVFRIYLPKPTIFGTSIVNNFLIKDVQTKTFIVSKCANENSSICAILNIESVFRISVDSSLPNSTVHGTLIVNNILTKCVQTKSRIDSKCANENLSIRAILNVVSMFRTYLPKPTVLRILIVYNFLTKGVHTKNQIVSKCANENLSIKTNLIQFARNWGTNVKLAPPKLFY